MAFAPQCWFAGLVFHLVIDVFFSFVGTVIRSAIIIRLFFLVVVILIRRLFVVTLDGIFMHSTA